MSHFRRSLLLILLCSTAVCQALQYTNTDVQNILLRLDKELQQQRTYINGRQQRIDSLQRQLESNPTSLTVLEQLAAQYTAFHNDSALIYYQKAIDVAAQTGDDEHLMRNRIKRSSLLPLGGFIHRAIEEHNSIDTLGLSRELLELYHDESRQMYSYIASFYNSFPEEREKYMAMSLESQRKLLEAIQDSTSPKALLNQGEFYYRNGELAKSEATLKELLNCIPETDNTYARATHIISDIAHVQGNRNNHLYYLALSAISDTRGATLEVTSLQELGQLMFDNDDVLRAHKYLYAALRNAVECHAETRMLQTSAAIPLIESVHQVELDNSRRRIYVVMLIMAVTLIALVVLLVFLRRRITLEKRLQKHLAEANHVKEEYISQFLNLCSIYMDKLNQFCKIANRKISTGKVDDLYKLTSSGKFVENQSKEFYEVFDNAFLHIYPDFVESVNKLLRPEEQIVLGEGELLNTDLRILAFMRLGIEESTRIAQILNYSVYTIYTYRNKLKNRAISRDTFEADVLAIDQV